MSVVQALSQFFNMPALQREMSMAVVSATSGGRRLSWCEKWMKSTFCQSQSTACPSSAYLADSQETSCHQACTPTLFSRSCSQQVLQPACTPNPPALLSCVTWQWHMRDFSLLEGFCPTLLNNLPKRDKHGWCVSNKWWEAFLV